MPKKDPSINRYAGIYYDPNLPWTFVEEEEFLKAAAKWVPRFSETLLEKVLPFEDGWISEYGTLPKSGPDYDRFYRQFYELIREWARSFHIEVDWAVNAAASVVIGARLYKARDLNPADQFGMQFNLHPDESTKRFDLPAWNPEAESESAYKARANKEWRRACDKYEKAIKVTLAEQGKKKIAHSRVSRVDIQLRYKWAVLHRCLGISIEEIAEDHYEATEYVRINVKRILAGVFPT